MKSFFTLTLILIISTICFGQEYLFEYEAVSKNSGFKMEGYWIWGGSIIKVDATYHMFASRWPKKDKFPVGYTSDSEIVTATSDSPEGPYIFQEVVIGERDSSFWDSNMAHNPTIHKIGRHYVLFYIGSNFKKQEGWPPFHRNIGYAYAKSIEGPWKRSRQVIIQEESNNPAVYVERNGNIKMMYRSADLRVMIAEAKSFKRPFSIVNQDAWPACKLEDFYLFNRGGQYYNICEDNVGEVSGHVRWGVILCSKDGISNWKKADPLIVYDHEIEYTDGSTLHFARRERPQLLIIDGNITHLITGVYDGDNSWCQPVKIRNPVNAE